MEISVTSYLAKRNRFASSEFEDAYFDSMLQFSLQHVIYFGNVSEENTREGLRKALLVCHLAGIESRHHFKQVYVFDINLATLRIDWLMSKTGFNLMMIQIPSLNEKVAQWLWKLANDKKV